MHSAIMSPDKKSGILLHDHGDGRIEATGLFNGGSGRGAGLRLAGEAVKHGANYAEAYGPHLPELYKGIGFQTVHQLPFDRSKAASTWNYETDGEPDYHLMTQGGVSLIDLAAQHQARQQTARRQTMTEAAVNPGQFKGEDGEVDWEAFNAAKAQEGKTATTVRTEPGSRRKSSAEHHMQLQAFDLE